MVSVLTRQTARPKSEIAPRFEVADLAPCHLVALLAH
jgi:hypothetical protein